MKRRDTVSASPFRQLTEKGTKKSKEESFPQKRTACTFYCSQDVIDKVRDVAYWDRKTVSDVIAEGLQEYIELLETKRGEAYPERTGEIAKGRPLSGA